MSLRCRSCNRAFHDKGSLDVHQQYAHPSNGTHHSLSDGGARATDSSDAEGDSSNHHHLQHSSAQFHHIAGLEHFSDRMYDMQPVPAPPPVLAQHVPQHTPQHITYHNDYLAHHQAAAAMNAAMYPTEPGTTGASMHATNDLLEGAPHIKAYYVQPEETSQE
jgi:hypothetical protein